MSDMSYPQLQLDDIQEPKSSMQLNKSWTPRQSYDLDDVKELSAIGLKPIEILPFTPVSTPHSVQHYPCPHSTRSYASSVCSRPLTPCTLPAAAVRAYMDSPRGKTFLSNYSREADAVNLSIHRDSYEIEEEERSLSDFQSESEDEFDAVMSDNENQDPETTWQIHPNSTMFADIYRSFAIQAPRRESSRSIISGPISGDAADVQLVLPSFLSKRAAVVQAEEESTIEILETPVTVSPTALQRTAVSIDTDDSALNTAAQTQTPPTVPRPQRKRAFTFDTETPVVSQLSLSEQMFQQDAPAEPQAPRSKHRRVFTF